MPNPVVHFEIQTKNAESCQKFFADLFGWHIDKNNPMNYGLVDTHSDGAGRNGGIAQTEPGEPNQVMIYVEVDDLQAHLDKAVALGGKLVMPIVEIPNMVTLATFADPGGNTIGLVKSAAPGG